EGPLPQCAGAAAVAVSCWDKMPDGLQLAARTGDQGATIRSLRCAEWMRWRFFEQPGARYCLHMLPVSDAVTAYAVTKRYRREGVMYGHIVDWQADAASEQQYAELLSSVWQQLAEWDVQRVSCWTLGDARLQRQLADVGFTPSGQGTNFCW